MQGTWVQSLVREDPMCHRTTKPVHHNYWSPLALEPTCCNSWSQHVGEPVVCNKKPPQWEAKAPQLERNPHLQLEKARTQQRGPRATPNKNNLKKFLTIVFMRMQRNWISHTLWKSSMVQSLWKIIWQFLLTLNSHSHDPARALTDIYKLVHECPQQFYL